MKIKKRKNKNLNAKELARYLAQIKAESVNTKWKNDFIIGCDQTLECMKKIISKPMNLKEAKENLYFYLVRNMNYIHAFMF